MPGIGAKMGYLSFKINKILPNHFVKEATGRPT